MKAAKAPTSNEAYKRKTTVELHRTQQSLHQDPTPLSSDSQLPNLDDALPAAATAGSGPSGTPDGRPAASQPEAHTY